MTIIHWFALIRLLIVYGTIAGIALWFYHGDHTNIH